MTTDTKKISVCTSFICRCSILYLYLGLLHEVTYVTLVERPSIMRYKNSK